MLRLLSRSHGRRLPVAAAYRHDLRRPLARMLSWSSASRRTAPSVAAVAVSHVTGGLVSRRWMASAGNGGGRGGGSSPGQPPPWVHPDAQVPGTMLKKFTVDLTAAAKEGKLDPVIGREEEMRRTIEVLSRRTKNNPVLIGEAGVGKTAIAEGLAQRIVAGEVPDTIKNKRVLSLDLSGMVAGAQMRGEFEDRLKQVLRDVEEDGDVILFCDEIHMLVGAGRVDGAMDASNMLKPALARGVLRCMGATTLDEYRRYIEKDGALARRFQSVFVKEPTVEDAISILRGLKDKYELHHGVKIMDSAVVAAANFAHRYLTDRKLPDKAIDLLDESASRLRMMQESKPEELAKLERRILTHRIEFEALKKEEHLPASRERKEKIERTLEKEQAEADRLLKMWQDEKNRRDLLNEGKERLDRLRHEYSEAIRQGDYVRASEIQYSKLPALEKQIQDASESSSTSSEASQHLMPDAVTDQDVAAVVSRHTGVPLNKLLLGERERLLNMEDVLRERVVGQEQAVQAISNAVRIARAGLHAHTKPMGAFLFLGPSGVGKTELAKTLADFLFDDESAMVRIDMSEYMERFSVSRLVGAPPGYVGYEEGGVLTEAVRRRPYQVILLDEMEKAHRDVSNLLLQVFDEGHLTDSQGRKVDFRNTIIIMTSNLGAAEMADMEASGAVDRTDADAMERVTMEAVKHHFRPEFINRLDQIVVFNHLRRENMEPIVDIQMRHVQDLVRDRRIVINADASAKKWLADTGFDPVYGARPLKRAVHRFVLNPLSREILSDKVPDGSTVTVKFDAGRDKDALVFDVEPPTVAAADAAKDADDSPLELELSSLDEPPQSSPDSGNTSAQRA
eukprot:TRINITY_DN66125_c0_g1_i1.p1 TRINITY_DN66125_c0_g1~~TRINITY_DN66125_c0_g1_i1.p1  ORF type:complete len:849 (-),score=446.65 TRINITY_DN66125_c0_g1_i1:592-3138(-)